MSKEKFLAVAFTDTDENGRFNPTKDALIAGIIDEDKSGTVTVGDTIQFGTYALDPIGATTTRGDYQNDQRAITAVNEATDTFVFVETSSGEVQWTEATSVDGTEIFRTSQDGIPLESLFVDHFALTGVDAVSVDEILGPGAPDTAVDPQILAFQAGDDAFLNVFIV